MYARFTDLGTGIDFETQSVFNVSSSSISSFRPKFRSYRPQDESLKESALPNAEPGDVISEVQNQLDAANTKVSNLFYAAHFDKMYVFY